MSGSTTPLSLVDRFWKEIIDEILDNLRLYYPTVVIRAKVPDNLPTLRACALVCRAFVARSQLHIFSILEFSGRKNTEYVSEHRSERRKGLHDLLVSKPHITHGIHCLSIQLGIDGIKSIIGDGDQTDLVLLRYLRSSNMKITTLHIGSGFGQVAKDAVALFIQPSIHTSFITSIRFQKIMVPISLVADLIHLSDIQLSNVSWKRTNGNDEAPMSVYDSPRPLIDTLDLWGVSQTTFSTILNARGSKGLPLLDFTQLRVFKQGMNSYITATSQLLDLCASSLEELWLDSHISFSSRNLLARFSGLRVMDLSTGLVSLASPKPFATICHILSMVPFDNRIATLNIHFQVELNPWVQQVNYMQHYWDWADWAALDAEVARVSNAKPLAFHLTLDHMSLDDYVDGKINDNIEEEDKEQFRTGFDLILRERFQFVGQCPWITFRTTYSVNY